MGVFVFNRSIDNVHSLKGTLPPVKELTTSVAKYNTRIPLRDKDQ